VESFLDDHAQPCATEPQIGRVLIFACFGPGAVADVIESALEVLTVGEIHLEILFKTAAISSVCPTDREQPTTFSIDMVSDPVSVT
jgi:hypothetical protein